MNVCRHHHHHLLISQVQNRKEIISHYDMAAMLQNISKLAHDASSSPDTLAPQPVSAMEQQRTAGVQMSSNIDALIAAANTAPPPPSSSSSTGLYNMYWHAGRVPSTARDLFRASVLAEEAQPLRPFLFADCGDKPKQMRFDVKLVCSQGGRQVPRCCADQACQDKFMSMPFAPARGIANF
jgi:hypothetical protein